MAYSLVKIGLLLFYKDVECRKLYCKFLRQEFIQININTFFCPIKLKCTEESNRTEVFFIISSQNRLNLVF